MNRSHQRTVAIDFDGVLHRCSRGWFDGTIYDPPMPGAIAAVRKLDELGYRLVCFTCRDNLPAIGKWIYDNFGVTMHVTNYKPIASVYIDNRSVRFMDWDSALPEALEMLDDGWEE